MIEPRHPIAAALALVIAVALAAAAASPLSAADPPARDNATLAAREAELLDRYRDLERSFLRLADLLAATDPRRAAVLRSAFDRAREEQVGDRVAAIVTLLERGQLLKAGTSQQEAIEQLRGLVDLLESGAGERRAVDTKKEVRAFLGRLAKLIARQRDIEGSTEAGDSESDLSQRQRDAADEAHGLGDDIQGFAKRIDDQDEGEPARAGNDQDSMEGSIQESIDESIEGDDDVSRARRTRQRLQAAEQRMRDARERLDDAQRRDARREQQKAVEELETARAELEEILRQLREEEVERLLVQLETRIRGMLKAERAVLADTEKLALATAEASDRERELEAARLGREQTAITAEAAKAMALVRDDGSAVAIPQALAQVHDDSAQAAARLGRGDTRCETVALIGEIVSGLEEMLAAVEKAQQSQQEEQAGPSGGRAGSAGDQPLVDKLSELKMLRSLQMRVNTRTQRVARLLDDADRAEAPEWRSALERLADRQRAIERAARDIVGGLTE